MSASGLFTENQTRAERTEQALFRGATLTMSNPGYRAAVHAFLDFLLETDTTPRDLTVAALRLPSSLAAAEIVAKENGIAAGFEEFSFLLRGSLISVDLLVHDGTQFQSGDVLARLEGDEGRLLATERVGLNLLQRMCGIATQARRLQERVAVRNPGSRVVATRKTPCGLLDKRAVYLGGVGTHRIGLGDAILVKNNHLAILSLSEEEAVSIAAARAWDLRRDAAFIEIEVRSAASAIRAAERFRGLRERDDKTYPCLLLLDNMQPAQIAGIIEELRAKNLYDDVLIEASGGINEDNVANHAEAGADAISIGALTHSPRALDLAQRIS